MIFLSGTVANAVKLQTLDSKWQQKKESGEVLSKAERNERANWTQEDWLKHNFEEQAAQNREASKRTDISNKIMSGGTLTPDEEKYLEQEDPAQLQKYRQIKAEKKAYEEKLKNCKTKDEVQRLKTETLGGYVAALKKVENNPYIPMSEKLAKAQEMLAKTRNVQDVELKFIQSPEYDRLPTEAEEAEERSEERELENEQAMETIEDAADTEGDATTDETADELTDKTMDETENLDGDETETSGAAWDEDEDEKVRHRQGTTKDVDLLQDIEETCQRIQLNAQLEFGGTSAVRTDSEKKTGGQINIIV
jgi:hypothetical protein